MDYNRTIMLEASDAMARRRLTLIAITLATIPCYCIGWLALVLAPESNPVTPTPIYTETLSIPTPTSFVQNPTVSLTPFVITGTVTNTLTPTPTSTSTPTASSTPTLFQPVTNTPSYTSSPTRTYTPSVTPSFTQTFIPTITDSVTPSFTPSPSQTTGPVITNTPSITPFP